MKMKNFYKFDEMKRSEHMAVRNTVGWYLWTHQLLEVTGPDATAFLDRMLANPIANIKLGKERYTTMLNEQGEIIDDVVVFRHEENKYWVSSLFVHHMIPWFDAHKGDAQVSYEDVTPKWHMYAVQGPRSRDMVNSLVKDTVEELKFFSFQANEIDGIPVIINRAGFTGEKIGYEVYCDVSQADAIEEKLRAAAPGFDGKEVTEFQVMAWTLPTEAGFYYMRDLSFKNPLEVGLDKGIGWDKEFVGKEALLKIKETGPANEMLGFVVPECDSYYIRSEHLGGPGEPVMVDGEKVGRVQKFVYGFVKEQGIGYLYAKKGALKVGDHISLHGHEAIITERQFL